MRGFFITIAICIFMWPVTPPVQAQITGGMFNETISINLNPQLPTPGEEVEATISDYSLNTTGATISWSYAGNAQPQLDNQRTITLQAPTVGESADLTVTLTYSDGRSLQTTTRLRPLYLDIIVEPYTYTPPFYSGRALPIYGSQVQLTALLQDKNGPVNAADYTYTWRLNNKVVGNGRSPGGWQTLITIPHGRSQTIRLEVRDPSNRLVGRRLVALPVGEIDVQFYENHPLYGLSRRAITNEYNLISNTTSLYAIPYNLDINAFNQNLFTEWRVNNQRVTTGADPFEISLRRQGSGSTAVSFKLRNTVELLQGKEHSVTVNF